MSEPSAAVLALADDEMILAHRDSEWTGHAPILEEDIAFTNLALDEMGHAQLWYQLAADLLGLDPEQQPDRWIFTRPAQEFRNLRIVELPRGDWAFTTLRQFLFDSLEQVRLRALTASAPPRLRSVAAKIATEERYHLRHTAAWVLRLGRGTAESHQRMQSALAELWPFVPQMFDGELTDVGADGAALRSEWEASVRPRLEAANLLAGPLEAGPVEGRDVHTPHLASLLEEMQAVARAEPEGQW